ncbi:MAG: hypothetical protein ACE5FI_16420 [Anaerolineales bacterium]
MKRNASWLMAFDAEDRERKRRLGQRLIGVMLQFISTGDEAEGLLEEAEAIGRAHAHNAISMRLSLTEALRAAMFFRDVVVEAAVQLPETARVKPEANTRLLRRINKLLNAVQLAMVAEYEVSKHAQS